MCLLVKFSSVAKRTLIGHSKYTSVINQTFIFRMSDSEKSNIYGPALPPHLLNKPDNSSDVIKTNEISSDSESTDSDIIGPSFNTNSQSNYALEKRALEFKLANLDGSNSSKVSETNIREEWMIELPEIKSIAGMGLCARQFRTKEKGDFSDRSSWTNIAGKEGGSESKKQENNKESLKSKLIEIRDREQDEIAKKHKKKHKRNKSLMEIHKKKLKKEKKKVHIIFYI